MILQNYYFRLREDVRVQYENYTWSDRKLHSNWSNSNIIEIKVNNSNVQHKDKSGKNSCVTSYKLQHKYKLQTYEWQHKDKLRVTTQEQVPSYNRR